MNITQKINTAPLVYEVESQTRAVLKTDFDDNVSDPIDAKEVYDQIRKINDPEHPLTLEQLR
ncbi:hypothetical protein H4R20_006894, partial [Coemansia guatemalensis]